MWVCIQKHYFSGDTFCVSFLLLLYAYLKNDNKIVVRSFVVIKRFTSAMVH
jgi:hypothetical protein